MEALISTATEPIAYPDNAILNTEQVARWLQVSPKTIGAWPVPRLRLPGATVRYSAGAVLRWCEGRAE
jgi:hypothetical protein